MTLSIIWVYYCQIRVNNIIRTWFDYVIRNIVIYSDVTTYTIYKGSANKKTRVIGNGCNGWSLYMRSRWQHILSNSCTFSSMRKTWTIEGIYRYEKEVNPVQKTNKTIGAIGSCAIGIILNDWIMWIGVPFKYIIQAWEKSAIVWTVEIPIKNILLGEVSVLNSYIG